MKTFSAAQRNRNIHRMKTESFDLAIIGGGITGAGTSRDATSRGMKVALVEASDFASGTSSRSSKLIHGGIRYLENLEFGLVFEALSERKILFEIAPHLVHPLKFVIPIYKNSKVGMFKMGLGMWLYDVLSMFDAPETHEAINEGDALKRFPLLQSSGLVGAYGYYDAYMDDDRLTIETHRSAFNNGAVSANYVKVVDVIYENSKVVALICKDLIQGDVFQIQAKHFVSSVGPWTDIFGREVLKNWNTVLRPTKGIHLTFDRKRLPLKEAIVMLDDAKNRIVFGIPRHEMIIIGTTDTDYPGNPSDVHTDKLDVEYLLSMIAEYFPGANITEQDIIASYSGVRPLVYDGSATEGKTSREHKIWSDPRNITFVAGGKYTTYRHMAEQIVDFVLEAFPIEERARFAHPNTKKALNEKASHDNFQRALQQTEEWSRAFKKPEAEVRLLAERHGLEALDLLEKSKSENYRSHWQVEAYQAISNAMCLNLDDFYLRRSPLFLSLKDHGDSLLNDIVEVFVKELGWSDSQIKEQIDRLENHKKTEMCWR